MPNTPEIALIVALIALTGVLVNALVTLYNARKRGNIDEQLLKLKAELDQLNAREMARVQTEHTETLKKLEFERTQELADGERKRKADSERFAFILELLNPQEVIAFLREHDFGGMFDRKKIAPLNRFVDISTNPEQTFLFTELEQQRVQLAERARALSKLLGLNTHPRQGPFSSVLPENYINEVRPAWVDENATEINDAATSFVKAFEEFVYQCRVKLGC
jgi:hypothetical protein